MSKRQKLRVIVNGVILFTTVQGTQNLFGHTGQHSAVQKTLTNLQQQKVRGLTERHTDQHGQYDVQIDVL